VTGLVDTAGITHTITAGTVTTIQTVGGEYSYISGYSSNTATVAGLVIQDNSTPAVDVTGNYQLNLTSTQTIMQAQISHDIVNNTCPLASGENYTFTTGVTGGVTLSDPTYTWSYTVDGGETQTYNASNTLNIPSDGECHTYVVSATVKEGTTCTSNTATVTIVSKDEVPPTILSCPSTVMADPNNGTGVTPTVLTLSPMW